MLGLLGALAFGAIFTGAWISAEQTESKSRQSSQQNGHSFYVDKNGRMRHTGSGRKFTPEEIHQFMNPVSVQENINEYERKSEDLFEERFYAINYDGNKHYFLTEEDAINFYNKHKGKFYTRLYTYKFSKIDVEHAREYCHFDFDKYVGKLDKPWERRK